MKLHIRPRCVATTPAHNYKQHATRCAKQARSKPTYALRLCAHHERVGEKGELELWNPAVEPKR